MRELSFFLFKNSLGAKMRKGFRSSCNGDGSTSTLNQHNNLTPLPEEKPPTTLEEMILQLEYEEEMAKREKHQLDNVGRMSCVNNSDILRSARNALNQYPRFSLDGRDAMYRSSFQNLDDYKAGRRSVCCDHGLEERLLYETRYNHLGCGGSKMEKNRGRCLPSTLGGESVVWCKPGVVAKLMGLEAMPVPLLNRRVNSKHQQILRRQNLRRRAERHDIERRLAMEMDDGSRMMRKKMGSCSKPNYCVVKPVAVETVDGLGGWPMGRFR